MIGKYFSYNGELLPVEQAKISVDNIEFAYGYGVYEIFKIRKKILYFPDLHIERGLKSAQAIDLPISFSKEQIKKSVLELIDNIEEDSFNLKMMLVGNKDKEASDIYILASAPLYTPKKYYTQGVKATTHDYEREFHDAKSLSMLGSYLAYKKAKEQDAYDALLVDKQGFVREGTRTNLFYTDGEKIYTPPKEQVLEGVTRKTVMQALKNKDIEVIERKLKREELNDFKGYFFTSTSSKILPISFIDGRSFDIPQIVKHAIEIYNEFLREWGKEILR